MARKIDKMKNDIVGEVFSSTELENYMHDYNFTIVESDESEDAQNIIKFTNYKSQIWIECEMDDDNNILILNLKSISKINNESTRVEPFRTYQDLENVLNYFKENRMYHHWFTSCLMVSLGRRVGDTISLKWSDLFFQNGLYRERLTILKEEKTGIIESIFAGKVSGELVGLLRMIVDKDHFEEADSVLAHFDSRVKEYKNIGTAYVTTALELSGAQCAAVEKRLLETTKYVKFEMHYAVDPALIGGMVIRIGDRVVDSSVRTKLCDLTRELSKIQLKAGECAS